MHLRCFRFILSAHEDGALSPAEAQVAASVLPHCHGQQTVMPMHRFLAPQPVYYIGKLLFFRLISSLNQFLNDLYIKFGSDGLGNIAEYVENRCFAVEAPCGAFFLARKCISRKFGHGHFSKK